MWFISDSTAFLDAAGPYTLLVAVVIGVLSAGQFFADSSDAKWIPRIFRSSMTKSGTEYQLGAGSPEPEISPSPIHTYSRKWWVDEKTFQLERRAIFSKTWLFVTHASRFRKAGDYRTFEIAGFSFIVILGKDRELRAFHNVCRHRAYAVTKKESGSSIVLGCRYHGWSYDTKGKLIKAPEFENVNGFDKDLNGLWELKTEVREGMVFVNFEARAGAVGGVEDSKDSGFVSVLKQWKVDKMEMIDEWKIDGKFNWKIAEGHPFEDENETATTLRSLLNYFVEYRKEHIAPSASVHFIRLRTGNLLTLRILPQSKNQTTIECNVYSKQAVDSKANRSEIAALKDKLQSRVEDLELQHRKLLGGTTELASAQLDDIRQACEKHADAEKKLGAEIHPAARNQTFTQNGKDDDDLCKELENDFHDNVSLCGGMNTKKELDW